MIKKVLLGKDMFIEVLIYRTLIDSYISHDEFVLVNNVSKYDTETKEEIKILKLL